MRFFEIVVSGAALISSAFAVTIDTYPSSVEAGKTYTITYSPKDAPATFILRKGLSTDLTTIATIGTFYMLQQQQEVSIANVYKALAMPEPSPGRSPRRSPTAATTLSRSSRALRRTTLASSP